MGTAATYRWAVKKYGSRQAYQKHWREKNPGKGAEYAKKYRDANREKILQKERKRRTEHREELLARSRKYDNSEKGKEIRKKYRLEHKAEIAERGRRWCIENPEKKREKDRRNRNTPQRKAYHLKKVLEDRKKHPERFILRDSVRWMMQHTSCEKKSKSRSYVGCSSDFLRTQLQSLFELGMSWANYGEWHVDHFVPVSWFFEKPKNKNHQRAVKKAIKKAELSDPDLTIRMEASDNPFLFVASHWTNLQPRWREENLWKHNRHAG